MMRSATGKLSWAASAVLLAGLSACGTGSGSTSDSGPAGSASNLAGQTLTVYSGQHEGTTKLLVADFEKRTGASVQLKSNDEASLAGQLLQEGPASPADVFTPRTRRH